MARKKGKGTELEVFSDKAARVNVAIFGTLVKEKPQTTKQLLKQISKQKGLEETYYASLTKRLHCLQETGYIGEAQPAQTGSKSQASYELRIKAYLAMFLKENSMQDILDKATDTQAAFSLLALINALLSDNER